LPETPAPVWEALRVWLEVVVAASSCDGDGLEFVVDVPGHGH